MQLVDFSELRPLAEYETERETFRPRIIALKNRRRLTVGGHLTFLFENRDTVRYQVQEMIRIERITRDGDIRHELETYNELIPGANELSATLLIEYDSPEERNVWLRALLGLENHIALEVPGFEPVKARFDTRQIASDRISSVQYLRFVLGPERAAAFVQGARIAITHPHYHASAAIEGAVLQELAADLVS